MGIETPANSQENTTVSGQGDAESGAPTPENDPIDPDLAAIIDAWPTLPAAMRAGMLAMVEAARGKG